MALRTVEKKRPPLRSEPTLPAPRTRAPQTEGLEERFGPTDATLDLTRAPVIGGLLRPVLKSRLFQFFMILPNQILFWLVIFAGFFASSDPDKNFGTTITWYVWFALVFVMVMGIGRAWCVMCPFGGFGEWIQRKTFFARKQKSLGLGWKLPDSWAGYGLIISAVFFIAMSWAEEFLNIAGPGAPYLTSFMVLFIVGVATASFLLFERRTFCRYICPLSSVVGTAGTTGVVAGFRPRDRKVCLECSTRDCMRGGKDGYGCPWYTFPASSDTNAYCGLCSECYKACPNENIGLYAQKPLTSVIKPARKRTEIAVVVALLFGLVIFQQWNALGSYQAVDGWLNTTMHFPNYPNPVDYIGTIVVAGGILVGITFLISRALSLKTQVARAFSKWFAPIMYGLIPLMGAIYLTRQMPKFFNNAAKVPAVVLGYFHVNTGGLASYQILSSSWLVRAQLIGVGIGTLASMYAAWKIGGTDLKKLAAHQKLAQIVPSLLMLGLGIGSIVLYVAMKGAE